MFTPNVAARLSRCVTTRQLKELAQLGCVLCDQQYLRTARPNNGTKHEQPRAAPQVREWRDSIRLSTLLPSPLANRSLNSI